MNFEIAVLGAAESGIGAAVLAQNKGFKTWVSDAGNIKQKYKDVLLHHAIAFEEGKHTQSVILKTKLIIKSPGIPETANIIKQCRSKNIPIISEIEFADRYNNGINIGITGSNGKTTTTVLLGQMLKKEYASVFVGGNLGNSFAMALTEQNFKYNILELSSFQLENMYEFRANIAIITNITPDHLDRHGSMENYIASKLRITQNQTEKDYLIYYYDDPVLRNAIATTNIKSKCIPYSLETSFEGDGAWIENKKMIIKINSKKSTMSIEKLALQGKHILQNSMAASVGSKLVDVRKAKIRESLADFEGVEHRLEHVASIRGVKFINDSKATNVNSTWYGLESMTKPVVWIAGGVDKGNDYSALIELAKNKVKALICMGVDNEKLIRTFQGVIPKIIETHNMTDAVIKAYYAAEKGDVVLLSPACASFDLFENYEERGLEFKKQVAEL